MGFLTSFDFRPRSSPSSALDQPFGSKGEALMKLKKTFPVPQGPPWLQHCFLTTQNPKGVKNAPPPLPACLPATLPKGGIATFLKLRPAPPRPRVQDPVAIQTWAADKMECKAVLIIRNQACCPAVWEWIGSIQCPGHLLTGSVCRGSPARAGTKGNSVPQRGESTWSVDMVGRPTTPPHPSTWSAPG